MAKWLADKTHQKVVTKFAKTRKRFCVVWCTDELHDYTMVLDASTNYNVASTNTMHWTLWSKPKNKTRSAPTFPCIISRMVMLTNDESTLLIGSVAILYLISIWLIYRRERNLLIAADFGPTRWSLVMTAGDDCWRWLLEMTAGDDCWAINWSRLFQRHFAASDLQRLDLKMCWWESIETENLSIFEMDPRM